MASVVLLIPATSFFIVAKSAFIMAMSDFMSAKSSTDNFIELKKFNTSAYQLFDVGLNPPYD
jgi:hypothetical protein